MRSYLDGVRDGLRLANGKLEDMLEVAERLVEAREPRPVVTAAGLDERGWSVPVAVEADIRNLVARNGIDPAAPVNVVPADAATADAIAWRERKLDELAAAHVEGRRGGGVLNGACLRCGKTYPELCPDPWNCGK